MADFDRIIIVTQNNPFKHNNTLSLKQLIVHYFFEIKHKKQKPIRGKIGRHSNKLVLKKYDN